MVPTSDIESELKNTLIHARTLFDKLKNEDPNYQIIRSARRLPDSLLVNCKVVADRVAMLHRFPKGGVIAEVGTQHGRFAKKIMEICNPARLELFDLSFSLFEKEAYSATELERIGFNEGDSASRLSQFPEGHFDWIYIDADHGYEGVSSDIAVAKNRVKLGGLLVFNDYTWWSPAEFFAYGIPAAVHELCRADGWEFIFFGLNGNGYHDVAIKKVV